MTVVRSAGLRGFRATVAELGGDAETYARLAGLPVAALDADNLLVPDHAAGRALELAAADLRCPDLGLRIAARQDLGMLGALALAIQNSPTLGDALECTSRYLFLHAQAASLRLVADPSCAPGVAGLRYDLRPDPGPAPRPRPGQPRHARPLAALSGAPEYTRYEDAPPPCDRPHLTGPAHPAGVSGQALSPLAVQGTDLGLGFLHRAIRYLVGDYGLIGVELPYQPPAPLAVYEEFYGVPVRIRRPAAVLRVPVSLAARPLGDSNEQLRGLALAFLAEQAPGGPTAPLPVRVRSAVRESLATQPPELEAVARLLTLHPRTLQRRLAEHGTTFAAIVDAERREAALRYLTATDLPLSQIAALLGLSEQSALTRCCRRWWASTPSAVRREAAVAQVV